jgi:hypothetical protein
MTMAAQPSFEYLLSASTTSLESLQLSRLDQIAALKSQIDDAVAAWATAELDVRLTRLILETRLIVFEPQHRVSAQLHSLGPTVRCPIPHVADVLSIYPRPPVGSTLSPRLPSFSPSQSAFVRHPAVAALRRADAPAPSELPIAA